MKNYIIVHALGNTANDYWYPWVKNQIENRGHICYTPTMPGLEQMSYKTWKDELDKIKGKITKDTVVIGHSTGSIFLAHYLIQNRIKIDTFVGVVSFNEANHNGEHEDWDAINESFFVPNLQELRKYAKHRICFYSPTDIYDFQKLDKFATTVGAEKHIIEHAGHFTAATGYGKEFPELIQVLFK